MGSGQTEKTSEIRPQLGHVGGTGANILVESSNRTMLLPALTPASTGFRYEPDESLPGIFSFSNNLETSRDLSEASIWNLDVDRNSNHNSTPAFQTDTSNVSNPNAISWTSFTADTDWQFNVEDQLLAEPMSASTETCSTAISELDMSQFYNQHTQSFESTDSSGELLEILNLGEKVSTGPYSMLSILALAETDICQSLPNNGFLGKFIFLGQKSPILMCCFSRPCT